MIRHIVLVRFRSDTAPQEIEAIFAELAALRSQVAGFLSFTGGRNTSPEGLAGPYTHAFTVDFADASSRDAYLVLPAHQKAGARLVAAAQDGVAGLLVVDIAFT